MLPTHGSLLGTILGLLLHETADAGSFMKSQTLSLADEAPPLCILPSQLKIIGHKVTVASEVVVSSIPCGDCDTSHSGWIELETRKLPVRVKLFIES